MMPVINYSACDLSLIYLCDCSGSMAGHPIAAVNSAISSALTEVVVFEQQHPGLQVGYGAIRFANTASWHVPADTPAGAFPWPAISDTGGVTALGQAYDLLYAWLERVRKPRPGVFVLISDGMPTDDAGRALGLLLSAGLAAEALRFAVGIGAEVEPEVLAGFAGQSTLRVARVNSAVDVKRAVREFTLLGLRSALRQAQVNP